MTIKKISGSFNIGTKADFMKVARTLPIKLAVNTEKHFRRGFEQGGGQTDASKGGWAARKKSEKGGRRGILIKSGTLRRDVKQRMAIFSRIEVSTSSITQDYADVHNSGLRSGRGKGFTMPQREFIGKSKELERENARIISDELRDLLI
jgi:phage gpG-like protein